MDLGLVSREAFFEFHKAYIEEEHRPQAAASGGDFYNTQNTRIGQAFALRVSARRKRGGCRSRKRDALTGLHGGAFQEYARRLGVPLP